MSMFDPRMKHLVDNEGLRGLGAYWIIIEKLSILPEPRAQLDYLRAYCDSKKITLCYLKKIILEYDLFELDEDGYFMPKELNPLHKKGEKTEKTTQEKPDSKAKNDEKQQKVSRNKSKKQSDLSSNTLNNKYLAKNATNTNKKTIDINKTTTEEKEAAAADALSSPQTTPAPIEPWHTLIDKLTEESAWLDVACMHSGYGSLLKTHIKEAVEVFRQHVILHDNGNVLLNMKDTRQYFVNFVRAGQRTSQELHMLLQGPTGRPRSGRPLPRVHRLQRHRGAGGRSPALRGGPYRQNAVHPHLHRSRTGGGHGPGPSGQPQVQGSFPRKGPLHPRRGRGAPHRPSPGRGLPLCPAGRGTRVPGREPQAL